MIHGALSLGGRLAQSVEWRSVLRILSAPISNCSIAKLTIPTDGCSVLLSARLHRMIAKGQVACSSDLFWVLSAIVE